MYFQSYVAATIAAHNPDMPIKEVAKRSISICNELEMQLEKQQQNEKKACEDFIKCKDKDRLVRELKKEQKKVEDEMTALHRAPKTEKTKIKLEKLFGDKKKLSNMVSSQIDAIRACISTKHSVPSYGIREWSEY